MEYSMDLRKSHCCCASIGRGGSGLVMVVDDLREPLACQNLVDRVGLRKRAHVEVPVIVMSGILIVETWDVIQSTPSRIALFHVPVRYEFHPVGIDDAIQNND